MAFSILGASVGAIVGIVGLVVYTLIYNALNKESLNSSETSMLSVIPTILSAVIVISIVVGGLSLVSG